MPLLDVQRRFRELGRIRLGERTEKGHPRPLLEFRLTSPSRELLERAAECYGGEVEAWTPDPKSSSQWELNTKAKVLDVLVPPGEPISQHWEMWGPKQGVGVIALRRCDGHRQTDGSPCACPTDLWERSDLAKQGKACKPTTRLSIILPRIPDIGVWRMDTHGIIAAMELPGTVHILTEALQRGIIIPAQLRIEQRTITREDRKTTIPVPVLQLPTITTAALLAGEIPPAAGLPGLGAPTPAPLPAPRALPPLDDEPEWDTTPEPVEPLPAEAAARGVEDTPPLPDEPPPPPESHGTPLPGHGSASEPPARPEAPRPGPSGSSAGKRRLPSTPDHWKQAITRRKVTQVELLKKARELANELGVQPPLALVGITDEELCDRLYAWLEKTKPVKQGG